MKKVKDCLHKENCRAVKYPGKGLCTFLHEDNIVYFPCLNEKTT